MRTGIFGFAALGCILAFGAAAHAEDYLGSLKLFPSGGYMGCPRGSAAAEGQLLPISQNTALFALLGTAYGGDGKAIFALPDLRGKEPLEGTHYCIWLQGVFPSRP